MLTLLLQFSAQKHKEHIITHPQAPFKQTGPHFLGENLNKFVKLCIFFYIYFMLKDHRKPHNGTRCKGNLISLFSSIHYLFIILGIQKQKLINN